MSRILRYILVSDTGIAPCIEGGRLSLATCKPRIRAAARVGDWVIGFRPRPAPRGVVVWAGRVALTMTVGDYEREFSCARKTGGRADAVYRAIPAGGFKRLRPNYHDNEDEIRKDLSAPVLVFDSAASWYFDDDPRPLPDHLSRLGAAGRGHRVNGTLPGDGEALLAWLSEIGPPGVLAKRDRAARLGQVARDVARVPRAAVNHPRADAPRDSPRDAP